MGKAATQGPNTSVVNEVYGTFAIGLGMGPCFAVGKIWAAEQLIYNLMTDAKAHIDADGVLHGFGKIVGVDFSFEMYPGTPTQPICHRMEIDLGEANTPRFPGLCYIVFKDFPLMSFGNTLQATMFKIEVLKLPNTHTPTEV